MIRAAIRSWLGIESRSGDGFTRGEFYRVSHPGAGNVSPNAVLSNIAVAARCVALRSELMAQLPLKLYRRLPNGERERVSDHPLAGVLSDLSNPQQTAFEARELFVRALDTRGNAFARIERDAAGQVVALYPLDPTRTAVERLESGRLRFRYMGDRGPVLLLEHEVLHIRGSSEDGLLGKSPIEVARGALGLGLTLNNFARKLADNDFKSGGYIIQPYEANARRKKDFRESLADQEEQDPKRPKVLDPGAKYIPVTFSNTDAEVLETRKLSNQDVCHVFGIPPAVLGLNDSVSYGSAAEAARALVQNALQPLASRMAQAMQRCLLTPEGRRTYVIEHDLSGLLRGDAATRWNAYRTAREIGAMSSNEIRRFENLPAIEGGDDHTPLRTSPTPNDPIASTKT